MIQNRRTRRVVKASKSTSEMLAAFENKLAELGVDASENVNCGCDDKEVTGEDRLDIEDVESCGSVGASKDVDFYDDRAVEIYGEDYHEKYEDVGGGFDIDRADSIITLAEMKEYWNDNNMGDPVLAEYPNFYSWFNDTRNNFLIEV